MSNAKPEPSATPDRGPWRILILDRSGDDPKWLLATITMSADVRPAVMEPGGRRYADWPQVTAWVRDQVGREVRLVPIAAIAWRVDENGQQR
jgi:hypothetical protein